MPSTTSSRTASSSVPNDAHQRPLMRLNERPMEANGPSRSSTSNGPARLNITPSQIPGRISAMNAITSTIPSTIPSPIDGSSRRRPRRSESLDVRLGAQPGVADRLVTGEVAQRQRQRLEERRPAPTRRAGAESVSEAVSRVVSAPSRRASGSTDARITMSMISSGSAKMSDADDQDAPVPDVELDPRVEDLADAQRPQRRCVATAATVPVQGVFMRYRPPSRAGSPACRTRRPRCPGRPARGRPRR